MIAFIYCIGLPLIFLFIVIPCIIYSRVVEISRKYTLTKFLIAFPLVLITSVMGAALILVATIIPVLVFCLALNMTLVYVFKFTRDTLTFISMIEFLCYIGYILNITVVNTIKNFDKKKY